MGLIYLLGQLHDFLEIVVERFRLFFLERGLVEVLSILMEQEPGSGFLRILQKELNLRTHGVESLLKILFPFGDGFLIEFLVLLQENETPLQARGVQDTLQQVEDFIHQKVALPLKLKKLIILVLEHIFGLHLDRQNDHRVNQELPHFVRALELGLHDLHLLHNVHKNLFLDQRLDRHRIKLSQDDVVGHMGEKTDQFGHGGGTHNFHGFLVVSEGNAQGSFRSIVLRNHLLGKFFVEHLEVLHDLLDGHIGRVVQFVHLYLS